LTPRDVAVLLARMKTPWWIAGGWALDLFLGRETRHHEDLDVALLRGDEVALRHALPGWDIRIAHAGEFLPWRGDAPLAPPYHQFWLRRRSDGPWDFEVLLEDHVGHAWQFRREHRVMLPLDRFGRMTDGGVPYVAPEVALLYKAKHAVVEKNQHDFAAVAPALTADARAWLADAMRIAHPGHEWLAAL
jgi:hypothetical protein